MRYLPVLRSISGKTALEVSNMGRCRRSKNETTKDVQSAKLAIMAEGCAITLREFS